MILEVVDGGLLTTVQDAGRPDWTHVGVPEGGAADPLSLHIANVLAGNDPGAAALEMTLVGPRLVVREPGLVALAGADLGGRVAGGRRLDVGRGHWLAIGEEVTFDGSAGTGRGTAGRGTAGARAYLALAGGIDVPVVLGSRGTCLAGAFGGLDGRALRAGDRIRSGPSGPTTARAEAAWPAPDEPRRPSPTATLRVLAGPAPGLSALAEAPWRVAAAADRVGVRLEGRELPADVAGETVSLGVVWGAIQVPPDGRPIVLGPDHQTTGGYRVPAVVISADLPVLGQLRPGDEVRIVETDAAAAARALEEQRAALATGAAAMQEAAGWDRLAASAGG